MLQIQRFQLLQQLHLLIQVLNTHCLARDVSLDSRNPTLKLLQLVGDWFSLRPDLLSHSLQLLSGAPTLSDILLSMTDSLQQFLFYLMLITKTVL